MLIDTVTHYRKKDITVLQTDPTYIPDTSNTVYIIFMIIGIVGYLPFSNRLGYQAGECRKTLPAIINQATMKAGNISLG
jgi:hypothetical protein